MSEYEIAQVLKIEEWENEEPGVVAKASSVMLKPLGWVVEKVIPQKAIQGALVAFNAASDLLVDKKDILRDGGVSEISELKLKDLSLSDKLANEVHNWAMGIAGGEGAASGFFGLAGMVADVPTLITLALRTIKKIGICYGYESNNEEEKMAVLQIMAAAGANTYKEKMAAVIAIKQINVMLASVTWKKMGEMAVSNKISKEALMMAIKATAKQLGINLTKRKALQAIPIAGAGVAAAMNVAFITDIAWAARRSYQMRWLTDNGKLEQ